MAEAIGEASGASGSPLPAVRSWEQLAEVVGAPPFVRPGWIHAWAECFDSGEIELVEVRRGEEVAAVLPLLRQGERLRSPTNWHSPMFGPIGTDAEAREEVVGRAMASPAVTLDLNFLEADGVELQNLRQLARAGGRATVERQMEPSPVILLEGDFESYEQGLSRNRRKALRRQRRKLEDEGRLQFEVLAERDDLERALPEAFAVEASGWKGQQGTAITSRPETARFYSEIARWAAAQGWLRLAFLRLDGRPIACDFALEQGGSWYTLKAGYDERYKAFGPGALLLRDEIAHCFERGLQRIELLGQQDEFKASWTEHTSPRVWIRAYRRSGSGLVRCGAAASWERIRPLALKVRGKL